MTKIPLLNKEDIVKRVPGINPDDVVSLISHLNSILERRSVPLYIFFNPDLESHAKNMGVEPKSIFQSLNFLSSHFSDQVKHKVIFDQDGIFYHLQEEDLKELNEHNRLHNPDDPRIIYERAKDLVRHAFVIGLDR